WRQSIAAVNKYLADESSGGLWYSTVDMNTGQRIATHYGALDAFFPAVLALSGDLERAKKLQESSYKMWTTWGVEPEEIDYTTMKITYDGYALRPEIIESTYYLHALTRTSGTRTSGTHDPKYLEMGRTYLNDLKKCCRTDSGYAALKNV